MTRGRGRWDGAVMLAAVIAASTWAATVVAPAEAGACPSTSASTLSFEGNGTISFSGSASGPDQSGGTESVKLDDTMARKFGFVGPVHGTRGVDFFGYANNSASAIDDTYRDVNSSGTSNGTQTGGSTEKTGYAGIIFNSPVFRLFGACQYQVSIRLTLETKTSGTGNAAGPPGRLSIFATSGLRPIPANLKLKGDATVNAYCTSPTGLDFANAIRNGEYYLDGEGNAYESAFCGARSSSGVGHGQPVGKAIISWNFRPEVVP